MFGVFKLFEYFLLCELNEAKILRKKNPVSGPVIKNCIIKNMLELKLNLNRELNSERSKWILEYFSFQILFQYSFKLYWCLERCSIFKAFTGFLMPTNI